MSHKPGLYIHIPFCRSKCNYCSFYSISSLSLLDRFIEYLPKEMEMYRGFGTFDSVYFGGGTPSVLSMTQLETVMAAVRSNFDIAEDAEITFEANPADIDFSYLLGLGKSGFNRLNIGVQSFDETILRFLERRHSPGEASSAITAARFAGFGNLGIDLIYGVPGQTAESWRETLDQALTYSPEHLSCYQLSMDEGTPLGEKLREGLVVPPDKETEYYFFILTSELLTAAGYIHYEVSNFAKKASLESKHNRKYWDHAPYLGIGPAAHSFSDGRRWWNFRSVDRYMDALRQGMPPREGEEILTPDQLRTEALFLGLRTGRGIQIDQFNRRHADDLIGARRCLVGKLEKEGLLSVQDGFLKPTLRGLAVADALAACL